MRSPKKRTYISEVRQKQADETRARIVTMARKLLEQKGYAGMTIEGIAQAAGVAAPTVYAIFKSKTGLLSEILDASRFGDSYEEALAEHLRATDPRERLRRVASIASSVYRSEDSILNLLRGAEAVAPELAQHEKNFGSYRYEVQEGVITGLAESGCLRAGLSVTQARDILWSFTSRDFYRLLVRERGWTPKQYEEWLAQTLLDMLAAPAES